MVQLDAFLVRYVIMNRLKKKERERERKRVHHRLCVPWHVDSFAVAATHVLSLVGFSHMSLLTRICQPCHLLSHRLPMPSLVVLPALIAFLTITST